MKSKSLIRIINKLSTRLFWGFAVDRLCGPKFRVLTSCVLYRWAIFLKTGSKCQVVCRFNILVEHHILRLLTYIFHEICWILCRKFGWWNSWKIKYVSIFYILQILSIFFLVPIYVASKSFLRSLWKIRMTVIYVVHMDLYMLLQMTGVSFAVNLANAPDLTSVWRSLELDT